MAELQGSGWQRGRHGGQPSRGQGAAQGTAQSFCTPGCWCFKEPLLIRAWNTIADPQKQRGNVVSLFTWKNEIQMFFSHDALNYTFACKGTFPNCECFRPNSCKISFMFLFFFCVCVKMIHLGEIDVGFYHIKVYQWAALEGKPYFAPGIFYLHCQWRKLIDSN